MDAPRTSPDASGDADRASALRYQRLRARFPLFAYESYEWREDAAGTLHCSFLFRTGEHVFRPSCRFLFAGARRPARVAREVMDNLVFHLGLAELPSYWKATCSPRVEVRAGALSREQIDFWTSVLTQGMGEFHYFNQTPFSDPDFVTIVGGKAKPHVVLTDRLKRGYLIPVGGGKDSLVTLDLLGRHTDKLATIAINPPPSTEHAVRLADVGESVVIERTLDRRLLQLNQEGYLNGHTPFGAVIGLTSALAAIVLGYQYIALSNESSADYATLRYQGQSINHQYGKSAVFEALLRRYLATHVASDLYYFSFLRPFNELRIAQCFSQLSAYHAVFRSCNRGRKTDSWCGQCPKCLSTFIILAPFMRRSALVDIFDKDLLQDPVCQAMLPSLLSEDGAERPFECIATPAELRVALALCRGERMTQAAMRALTQPLDQPHQVGQGIPEDLSAMADAALRPRLVPLLDHAAVGVVGLGVEGASTCRHLLSSTPQLDLTIIDDDAAAVERLPSPQTPSQRIRFVSNNQLVSDSQLVSNNQLASDSQLVSGVDVERSVPALDIVFKSPGVPPEHPAIMPYRDGPAIVTSNTALFFERCAGTVIGVTGTKGKSTTTSLIAHVLRAAGRDARLLGNIGRPCLDGLDDGHPESIYCVELSSFQLEGLQTSPDIAVVLGIFGDHLDRHGDMASYVAAKSSITRYQSRRDRVLYNANCPHATALAQLSPARRIAFGKQRPDLLGESRMPLLGDFNHYNVWPAIFIGRHFGMDDAALAASIGAFQPLPGRLETVVDKDGVRFVCDIRSTAPEVTVAALDAFDQSGDGVDFLLLGGVDRHQDYRLLVPALSRSAVRHIILFPPTGHRIRAILADTPLVERFVLFEPGSMEEAIRYVYERAPAGRSVCLMSTAAPSNGGLFAGPEDKARQFAHWAAQLGREALS